MTSVFLDLFTLRKYESIDDLRAVVGVKKNGLPQTDEYVNLECPAMMYPTHLYCTAHRGVSRSMVLFICILMRCILLSLPFSSNIPGTWAGS